MNSTIITLVAIATGLSLLMSAVGWGVLIAKLLPHDTIDILDQLGLGILGLSLIVALIGAGSLLGSASSAAVIFVGLVCFFWRYRQFPRFYHWVVGLNGAEKFLVLTLGLHLISKVLFALVPQLQTDPLYYHVASARVWAEAGAIRPIWWLPWAMQGGLFEYIYTLLATMAPDSWSLLLASQLVHAVVGCVAAPAVLYSTMRKFEVPRFWVILGVLAFVVIPRESQMLLRAKNDGAVLFAELLALRGFMRAWPTRTQPDLHVYLMSGFAVGCKWTALFFILPLAVVSLFRSFVNRYILREIVGWALAVVMVLPIVCRNIVWSGNPLFPAFGSIFTSPLLNDYLRSEIAQFSHRGDFWSGIVEKFIWFFGDKPWNLLAVIAPLVLGASTRSLTAVAIGTSLVFVAVTGSGAYVRFCFVLYGVFCILATPVWSRLYNRFGKMVLVFGVIASVVNAGYEVPWKTVFTQGVHYWFGRQDPWMWGSAESSLIAIQRQMNLTGMGRSDVALGCVENENLFLTGGATIPTNHLGASEVLAAGDVHSMARKFDEHGFKYLLASREKPTLCWQKFMDDPEFSRLFSEWTSTGAYQVFLRRAG